MSELTIGYIRPMARSSEQHQRDLIAPYAPDRVLVAGQDDVEDARKFMRRAGRKLIVPQLATLHRKRSVIAAVVHDVLAHGCSIIEARYARVITPECRDAVMAGLEAPRHDVDRRKQRANGKAGGERTKYAPDQLEATRDVWLSSDLTHRNAVELTGISYATLQRWWLDRPVPVRRPVGPGRR